LDAYQKRECFSLLRENEDLLGTDAGGGGQEVQGKERRRKRVLKEISGMRGVK